MQSQIENYSILGGTIQCDISYTPAQIAATWNEDKNALVCYCETLYPGTDIEEQM